MKGKYKNRATVVRDWGGLEQRAKEAEHENAKLASELQQLRTRHEALESTYRRDTRALIAERDRGTGPAVEAARDHALTLQVRLRNAEDRARDVEVEARKFMRLFYAYFARVEKVDQWVACEVIDSWATGKHILAVDGLLHGKKRYLDRRRPAVVLHPAADDGGENAATTSTAKTRYAQARRRLESNVSEDRILALVQQRPDTSLFEEDL